MSESTRPERDPSTVHTPAEAAGRASVRSRLEGRRILVVGAGARSIDDPDPPEGNGRAISILCAREGAQVGCADRDEASARETTTRIEQEGNRAALFTADVTDPAACAQLIAEANEKLGGLDGLVLNVGTAFGRGLAGTDLKAWDDTFSVNLRSHFLLCKAALPLMPTGSSIVFISSVAGLRPGSLSPAYDSSKAGLAGLCRHVALEGSVRGIRANVINPGLIDTPLGRLASKGRASRAGTPIPLGRQGTGWEVAYATSFLLSGESSYITGQSLVVDGGLSSIR